MAANKAAVAQSRGRFLVRGKMMVDVAAASAQRWAVAVGRAIVR